MPKHILLINDLPGYGKVALSAMMPVLSHMGHHLYPLPTALVSNTLDYGKFEILETTDYMRKTFAVWAELGFRFDAVATGFIVSAAQAALTADFCRSAAKRGTLVFVDPIMGDEGHLYNGVTEQTVVHMREMAAAADYVVPNYTEAAYLVGRPWQNEQTRTEIDAVVDGLLQMGAKSAVVTSARVEGRDCVAGYDGTTRQRFLLPFDLIPVRFPGTGDIFSAVLLGSLLEGQALPQATQRAMDAVREMISRNRNNADKYAGIPLETCLEVLD